MKTILVDAIGALVIEGEGVFKEMHDLLETFPNRKIVLTGAKYEHFKKLGLEGVPYEVFTLEHDPEKTDPEYFKIMLKQFDISNNDVIYFEHNPDAIKSAEAAGIKTYYYDSSRKDLEELLAFLNTNL